MASSTDVEKMHTFGQAEQWAFAKVLETNEEFARKWVEKLESTEWLNYITRDEADSILGTMVNQDGTKGYHWDYNTTAENIKHLGGDISDEPYYNCYAMWVTVNMIYSDHIVSLSEVVDEEHLFPLIYKMAVEKLKDRDRRRFIRKYYDL